MEKRVFSEKEAAEILQRAAKIQEESTGTPYSPGVSLEELKRIAVEAGIDVSVLDKAIHSHQEVPVSKGIFPLLQEHERVVDGELSTDNFDIVYEVLKRPTNQFIQQVGRTMQIRSMAAGSQVIISIACRNDRTKINVRPTIFVPFMTILYPALLLSFIALVNLSVHGQVLWGLLATFAALAIAVPLFIWRTKSVDTKARKLANDLADLIQQDNEAMRQRLAAPQTQQETVSEPSQVHVHDSNV